MAETATLTPDQAEDQLETLWTLVNEGEERIEELRNAIREIRNLAYQTDAEKVRALCTEILEKEKSLWP